MDWGSITNACNAITALIVGCVAWAALWPDLRDLIWKLSRGGMGK